MHRREGPTLYYFQIVCPVVLSAVSKTKGKTRKIVLFEKKITTYSCNFMDSPYLCIVFFIVLDLRLTRLGYSGIPFFLPFSQKNPSAAGFPI